jgi:hypothetical protein
VEPVQWRLLQLLQMPQPLMQMPQPLLWHPQPPPSQQRHLHVLQLAHYQSHNQLQKATSQITPLLERSVAMLSI